MKLNRLQKILAISARMLVGAVFMFSGFVKGIDPVGLNLKLQEYFFVYGIDWLNSLGLYIGVLLCMIEFVTGAALFFNLRM
ncbi:MAG: MauE/DoxX family redox-associated membrane protein, partial [Bacteroidota bacterium]